MQRTFILILLLIGPTISGASKDISTESTKACTPFDDLDATQRKLWKLLQLADFVAVDEFPADAKAAMNLVREARNCATTKYQRAVVIEMHGTVAVAMYKTSGGEEKYAKDAEKRYLQALAMDTEHNEVLHWRMANFMRLTKQYERAVYHLNQLLKNKNAKLAREYLALALQLSVEMQRWEEAKNLVDILMNKDQGYLLNIQALSATVKTLCHYKRRDNAAKVIAAVEQHRSDFSVSERKLLNASKAEINGISCAR